MQDSLLLQEAFQHTEHTVPPCCHIVLELLWWYSKLCLQSLLVRIGKRGMLKMANNFAAPHCLITYTALTQHSLVDHKIDSVGHTDGCRYLTYSSHCQGPLHASVIFSSCKHFGKCLRDGFCFVWPCRLWSVCCLELVDASWKNVIHAW